MKFLVDVCAGHFLAEWLRSQGHDVVEVRDKDNRMADGDILAWAASQGRILVTMDKDFTQFIRLKKIKHAGVIHLENLPVTIRITHLARIIKVHEKDLVRKAVIIQKGSKIRISYR